MRTPERQYKIVLSFLALLISLLIVVGCSNNTKPVDTESDTSKNDETKFELLPENPIWDAAFEIYKKINDPDERDVASDFLAERLMSSGYVSTSLEYSYRITHPGHRAESLTSLTAYLSFYGEIEKANKSLQDALEICDTLDNPMDTSSLLSSIAEAYKALDENEMADNLYARSREAIESIRSDGGSVFFQQDTFYNIYDEMDERITQCFIYVDMNQMDKALDEINTFEKLVFISSGLSYMAQYFDDREIDITPAMEVKMKKINQKADSLAKR